MSDDVIQDMVVLAECRICQSKKLERFISLGPIPLANSFLRSDQLAQAEDYYPLDVCYCNDCGLVQLAQVVSPQVLFKDYAYQTGTSDPLKVHFGKLAENIVQRFGFPIGSFIVDIGSNDGTLLANFKTHGMRALGVEPAGNIAQLASKRGIETLSDFFDKNLAHKIFLNWGHARVITATNVFAHVHDLKNFVEGISYLMTDDGVFVIEVPYLMDMLAKVEFDTIYHEHLSYFALRPLITLFRKFGMSVSQVERIKIHGGSLRVYVEKTKQRLPSSVTELLELEVASGMFSMKAYKKFAEDTDKIREELVLLLKGLKKQRKKITGYGAPAKGNVLLNYCKIGTDILDFITDTTPFKQGRYTPGMHIPVVPETHFHELKPDYALLLAWNYADEIRKKESSYLKAGGKFIVPIPTPRIV